MFAKYLHTDLHFVILALFVEAALHQLKLRLRKLPILYIFDLCALVAHIALQPACCLDGPSYCTTDGVFDESLHLLLLTDTLTLVIQS